MKELDYIYNAINSVYEFGQKKYKNRTLSERVQDFDGDKELAIADRLEAFHRHLSKCKYIYRKGKIPYATAHWVTDIKKLDKESELPHLYHMLFNIGMIIVLLESEGKDENRGM